MNVRTVGTTQQTPSSTRLLSYSRWILGLAIAGAIVPPAAVGAGAGSTSGVSGGAVPSTEPSSANDLAAQVQAACSKVKALTGDLQALTRKLQAQVDELRALRAQKPAPPAPPASDQQRAAYETMLTNWQQNVARLQAQIDKRSSDIARVERQLEAAQKELQALVAIAKLTAAQARNAAAADADAKKARQAADAAIASAQKSAPLPASENRKGSTPTGGPPPPPSGLPTDP